MTAKLTDKDDAPRKVKMAIFFSILEKLSFKVVSEVGNLCAKLRIVFPPLKIFECVQLN